MLRSMWIKLNVLAVEVLRDKHLPGVDAFRDFPGRLQKLPDILATNLRPDDQSCKII